MYAKIKITGDLEVVTGLHIGTSNAFSAIGSVDSPVVRDPLRREPIIPGSSLKGKMRALLAKHYNEHIAQKPDQDDERLLRLFGAGASSSAQKTGRLLFTDMPLSNADELRKRGADSLTEVKFENNIDRITAVAELRQIERVIRGSRFALDLIYEYPAAGADEALEDFETICRGLDILQHDYLGGSGSRGYGRVSFANLSARAAVGTPEVGFLDKVNEMLGNVGGSDEL